MKISETIDFLTLEEVKGYMRIEHDLDDSFFGDLIAIAIEQSDNFLQNDFKSEVNGEWVDLPIPFSCKLACLKMISSWYEVRSDDITQINAGGVTTQLGEMPWDAMRLLHPYRKLVGT